MTNTIDNEDWFIINLDIMMMLEKWKEIIKVLPPFNLSCHNDNNINNDDDDDESVMRIVMIIIRIITKSIIYISVTSSPYS